MYSKVDSTIKNKKLKDKIHLPYSTQVIRKGKFFSYKVSKLNPDSD
jgi:hypothetical protein